MAVKSVRGNRELPINTPLFSARLSVISGCFLLRTHVSPQHEIENRQQHHDGRYRDHFRQEDEYNNQPFTSTLSQTYQSQGPPQSEAGLCGLEVKFWSSTGQVMETSTPFPTNASNAVNAPSFDP